MLLRHFRKFCALWLVAQVLLPFTAPFPTCDLSDFLGRAHHHDAPLAPPHSHVDGDYAVPPPLTTTDGRLKLEVVSALDVSNVVGVVGMTSGISRGWLLGVIAAALEHREIQATVLRL